MATLVASGTSPESVFRAVADEVAALLSCDTAAVVRFEPDGTGTMLGTHRTRRATGERFEFVPGYVLADLRSSGRPARFDTDDPAAEDMPEPVRAEGIRSGLASPIVVDGELWGAMTVASLRRRFPPGTEGRLTDFTDLVATAVSNALARGELRRLAEEQAALRRVATLVAEGASPTAVFDAAADELGALLQAEAVTVCRYEPGDEITVVAHRGPNAAKLPAGTRFRADGGGVVAALVRRTRRPARMDGYPETAGEAGELIRRMGYRSGVGAPIVVEGRLWGAAIANWSGGEPAPPDTEERMAQFTELLDTAIANADSRDQLTASRVRLLTEADEARRRLVRDLHDGAQQRLVHTIVSLKLAREALRAHRDSAEALVDEALEQAERSNAELRELAHGILPGSLTLGGLRGALGAVLERLDLPVDIDVLSERLPPEIEASAYFIVAEALTNVAKHAHAGHAAVSVLARDDALRIEVRDDGIGGADPGGHGLVGLADRATALGGRLEVASRPGGGTVVSATLPLARVSASL